MVGSNGSAEGLGVRVMMGDSQNSMSIPLCKTWRAHVSMVMCLQLSTPTSIAPMGAAIGDILFAASTASIGVVVPSSLVLVLMVLKGLVAGVLVGIVSASEHGPRCLDVEMVFSPL